MEQPVLSKALLSTSVKQKLMRPQVARSRRQGLRAGLRPVLASALRAALTAALRRDVFDSGNPALRPLKRRQTVLVTPSGVWPQSLSE